VLLHYLRKCSSSEIALFYSKCSITALPLLKQSPLDFLKLVELRLILMLLYDSLNLIISGFTNHIWALGVIGQKSEVERFGLCAGPDVSVHCF